MPVGVLPGLVLLAATTTIRVEGATTCPTPDMVATRLAALLPRPSGVESRNEGDAPQRARLIEDGGQLVVELKGPAGETVGTRRLARSPACEGLASAVAVSIAVWVSDVHPEFSSAQLTPGGPRAALAAPPDSAPALSLALAPAPARGPAGGWRLGGGLALGFGGSVDIPIAAADLLLAAWLRPPLARTALRAEIEGQSDRQVALQDGKSVWRRWIVGLGLERSLPIGLQPSGAGWLRAFGLARVAVLDLHGEGFAMNHRDRVLDAGMAAGIRAVHASGSWTPWLELSAALWPIGHDAVAATGASSVRRLPAVETFVRLGAGWGAGR